MMAKIINIKGSSDRSSGIDTLDRIYEILNLFNLQNKEWTLSEISQQLLLPKSTTFRFLAALKMRGLLNSVSNGNRYRLGYQLMHWGDLAKNSIELREIALPVLYNLVEKTDETAILSVRDGTSCVWIEQVESKQPIRWVKQIGVRLPLHAGSSAKILLAFLPDYEVEKILNSIELYRIQPSTITDKQKMMEEIRSIRSRGYAISFEEVNRDTMGIAGPVYNYSGQIVAGLGIIAPISRGQPEKIPGIAKSVLEACSELSRKLGGK